jgi:hypothetical protein
MLILFLVRLFPSARIGGAKGSLWSKKRKKKKEKKAMTQHAPRAGGSCK